MLEVEYVPAVLPPTPKQQHLHDDWVSAVAGWGADPGCVASGAYDGVVRLWSGGECSSSYAAHKGAVKAAVAVEAPGDRLLLTAGADAATRVWRGLGPQQRPEALAVLVGHADSVECAAASPDGQLVASGGWDGKLLLWRCGAALVAAAEGSDGGSDEEGGGAEQAAGGRAAARKRRRGAGGAGIAAGSHEEAPRAELVGHGQCVAGVAWPALGALASASWDHSVRLWDVETGTNTDTLNHNKAVHAVAAAPSGSGGLVAFGGAERAVRLWDPRARSSEVLAVRSLPSHGGWVAALAWHPTSLHHLVSASHDGSAKLWDVRASIPLHTVASSDEKLLCVGWVGGGTAVAAGGADRQLRVAEVQV